MTNQSQTDPTALQGPQNRAQRSVQWIATDPKTGMPLDEMAAFVQNAMRADTAVLESLLTGVGNADQGHRGIPQPGMDGEDRGGTMSMFICGLDGTRADREDCPNSLHDHPLAASPMVAMDEVDERLDAGWTQDQCPDCGLWGWIKPDEEGKR